MYFLNYGDGHAGGVCSFTDYLCANEDGAWVGLERYPHPTDSQYSWVSRLAEVYSARVKSFCRHNASIESILQELCQSIDMYKFDECYSFIGLPRWQSRIYPLYGDWGSAKEHTWSYFYKKHGIDCRMDGTEFNREFGKQLIIEMLRTNGVKPKDITFKSYYDPRFGSMLTEKGFNPGGEMEPMISYHPDNPEYEKLIDEWLDQLEQEYLDECKEITSTTENLNNKHFTQQLVLTMEMMEKRPNHKFFFYFTEDKWNFPSDDESGKEGTSYTWESEFETDTNSEDGVKNKSHKVDFNIPNTYWFWGVSMKHFFKNNPNLQPRIHDYYKHEDHYQFSRYMRDKILEENLIS